MKALTYQGPGAKAWSDIAKPVIDKPTDAIVRILHTTICGTDLHILKGDVPEVTKGTVLGHEGVGVVEAVGPAIRNFKPGDHVLISCITSCGSCPNCRRQMYSHCALTAAGFWATRLTAPKPNMCVFPMPITACTRYPPARMKKRW